MFWTQITNFYLYLKSKNFKTTKGIIISSRCEKSIWGSKNSRRNYYYAVVKYSYVLDNKKYFNDKLGTFYNQFNYLEACEYVKKFPKGKEVIVFYNPKNPQESFLIRKLKLQTIILPTIYIVILTFMGILFWYIFT